MNKDISPGDYTIEVFYRRDPEEQNQSNWIRAGKLIVEKTEGTDAYLNNIPEYHLYHSDFPLSFLVLEVVPLLTPFFDLGKT